MGEPAPTDKCVPFVHRLEGVLRLHRVAAAVTLLILLTGSALLTGCRGAVATPTHEPAPGLQGTWRTTEQWQVVDGPLTTEVHLLTFTAGGRAIDAVTEYDATTGERLDEWATASGWRATDDTVTRLWFDDFDDPPEGMVDKSYYWGDPRHNFLFMHTWWERESSPEALFTRYERVPDALPDLVGRWTGTLTDFDGNAGLVSLTVGADGSVVYERPIQIFEDEDHDNGVDATSRLVGTGTLDPDTYFLNLTGATLTLILADGSVYLDQAGFGDGLTRMAVAPTDRGIVVSDPETEGYGSDHAPFGGYWTHLERAE